jgi:hypothetical protein
MTNLMGIQAKYILESTFDAVANKTISCVTDTTVINYKAIVHDEIIRARREHLEIDNDAGILNLNSKRVILLTRDILASGLETLDSSWYLLIGGKRYDFSTNEPFCDVDTTPFADADQIFSVFYTRRAEELESQISPVPGGTGEFSFDSWALSK